MAEIAGILKVFTSVAGFLGGMGGSDAPADTMIEGVSARDDASMAALEDSGGWRPVIETGGNEIASNEYQTLVEELQADGTLTNGANVGEITGNANVGEITANGAGNTTGASFTDQPQNFTFARGAAMEQPSGMLGEEPYGASGGQYSFAADQGQYGGGADQQSAGAQAASTGGAALGTGPTTQQPQGMLAQSAKMGSDMASPTGRAMGQFKMDTFPGETQPEGLWGGPAAPGKPMLAEYSTNTGMGDEQGYWQRGVASQTPQAPTATRGYAGGAGAGVNTQLQPRPFAPSQQGKGGFDMNAAFKAMSALAASRKKEEEKRLIQGASARQWQQGYPGAPGTPAGIAGAQQQGVLAQAALGGQTFSPVRPIMPSPYRRPAIA